MKSSCPPRAREQSRVPCPARAEWSARAVSRFIRRRWVYSYHCLMECGLPFLLHDEASRARCSPTAIWPDQEKPWTASGITISRLVSLYACRIPSWSTLTFKRSDSQRGEKKERSCRRLQVFQRPVGQAVPVANSVGR